MGRSSSSSTTQNVQDIDTNQVNAEGGIGLGLQGDQNLINLQVTDAGAVDSAFDFADRFGTQALSTVGKTTEAAYDFAGDFASDAIEANSDITRNAISQLGSAITRVGDATRSDTTETFRRVALYGAIAAVAIVIGLAIARRGK